MTDMELYKYLRSYCKKAAAEGRPFEDSFSAFQNEMVRQSIDYAEKRAEKIYIYSDLEDGAIMARPAFRINGCFYPDYEWDKAIRDGKETSSLSREERGYLSDDSVLCSSGPLAVQRMRKADTDRHQAGIRREKAPCGCEVRL